MAKRMLIDATHPEETRVVVQSGNRLEEFDFESSTKKHVKGNIYLAKVTRVEPSLQAAFVDYGGNRHGFLAFSEVHPDYYRIPVGDRESSGPEPHEEANPAPAGNGAEDSGVPLTAALPEPVAVPEPPSEEEDAAVEEWSGRPAEAGQEPPPEPDLRSEATGEPERGPATPLEIGSEPPAPSAAEHVAESEEWRTWDQPISPERSEPQQPATSP
ncbi:MAG TPA: S1 RNA-binding domain-containing protein, partial [Stellaceae bacterium]